MTYAVRNPERLGADAVIPPITHPLGKAWDQPPREKIAIDGKHAVMDRATFDALCDYSTTVPSGVYDGKMWKARAHQGLHHGQIIWTVPERWALRWYGPADDPTLCKTYTREIIIV